MSTVLPEGWGETSQKLSPGYPTLPGVKPLPSSHWHNSRTIGILGLGPSQDTSSCIQKDLSHPVRDAPHTWCHIHGTVCDTT